MDELSALTAHDHLVITHGSTEDLDRGTSKCSHKLSVDHDMRVRSPTITA